MSLSQEPAFSVLKDELVCGYTDISKESYAGFSGKHEIGGQAINTTNGAGPHNLQTFVLASDGTVLHCLPGYWNPTDLVREIGFAARLHDVWTNPALSEGQKRTMFRNLHLAHHNEHPAAMVKRSKMQGFDQKYEAKHRLASSDTILDSRLAAQALVPGHPIPQAAFKTTDQIMHDRMASRPFVPFSKFDTAAYVDYGRPKYDKNEDFRNANGMITNPEAAKKQELLGQVPEKKNRKKRMMRRVVNTAGRGVINYGVRALR